ncbi:MAG: TetR/AcrR family transcriptional regulator [Actinomycetota bacterium]
MDKASRKRAEIIEAAYKVICEKGYHATRIEDIAAETGMAQGLFYHYFRNKLDIITQILDEVIRGITQGIAADAPAASNTLEEYEAQLRRAVDKLFDRFVEDPLLSRLLFYEALGIDEEINHKLQAAFDLFGDYSASYMRNGIQKGFLRPDMRIKETAFAFNAVVFEGARRISLSGNKEQTRRHWTNAIVDLMIRGTAGPGLLPR